jgi:hypothetical protein
VNQTQISTPHVYKSHLSFHEIPKGAKYICSFRHPDAQLLSFFRFLEGWWFEKGSLGLEEFAGFAVLRIQKTLATAIICPLGRTNKITITFFYCVSKI